MFIKLKLKLLQALIIIVYCSIQAQVHAQNSIGLRLYSEGKIPRQTVGQLNNDSLTEHYDAQPKHLPMVLALGIDVNISPASEGLWLTDSSGASHWLVTIESKTALNLGYVLSRCSLPEGTKIYFSNPQAGKTYGPYTSKHYDTYSRIFVEPLPGDLHVVECVLPPGADQGEYFIIDKISHDFRGFYQIQSGKRGKSCAVEIDVACEAGNGWDNQKRSVTQIKYPLDDGSWHNCTGTLINNTMFNGQPYVLTAKHCFDTDSSAKHALFYFGYERQTCNGTVSIDKTNYSIKGSKVLATSPEKDKLDFTLLKLSSAPPDSYKPYYAGWSLSSEAFTGATCIHHPEGDVKKISVSKSKISIESYSDNGYRDDSHWLVPKWDLGTTENGSSGSALFNNNRQLVGVLTGGEAGCNKYINDYYSMFSLAWDYFTDSTQQLKYWLAPDGDSSLTCDGYDPLMAKQNPVSNITPLDTLTIYSFGDKARGVLTGKNELGIDYCAEKFSGIPNHYLYGIKFPVAIHGDSAALSRITLHVWSNSELPKTIIFSHQLTPDSIIGDSVYRIRLREHIDTKGSFFVGFGYEETSYGDSAFFFTAANRAIPSGAVYVKYRGAWEKLGDMGINTSLGIELFVSNHVDPVVAMSKIPDKWNDNMEFSPRLIQPKELFQEDSISNFHEQGWLKIYTLSDENGYMVGTNKFGFNKFAEKIVVNDNKYITSIKLTPFVNQCTDSHTHINLCVWEGATKPGALKYSQPVLLSWLKANRCNVVKLQDKVKIDSVCFVGYEILDSSADTFGIYMGENTRENDREHSYFNSENKWMNFWGVGIDDALTISTNNCFSPYFFKRDSTSFSYPIANSIHTLEAADNDLYVFPNPSVRRKYLYLNLGTNFTEKVSVEIFDIFGRLIANVVPESVKANVMMFYSGNLKNGVYYVRATIRGNKHKPVKVIILH